MKKRIAALLRAVPNPFRWLADKLDPQHDAQTKAQIIGGGGGPIEPP